MKYIVAGICLLTVVAVIGILLIGVMPEETTTTQEVENVATVTTASEEIVVVLAPTATPIPPAQFVIVADSVGQVTAEIEFVTLPRGIKVKAAAAQQVYGTKANIKAIGRVQTANAIIEGGQCTPTNGADYCDSIALNQGMLAASFSYNAVHAYDEMAQRCGGGKNEITLNPGDPRFSFNACHQGYGPSTGYLGNGGGACQAASLLNAIMRKAGLKTYRKPHVISIEEYNWVPTYFPIFRMDGTMYNSGVASGDMDTVAIWTPNGYDLKADPRTDVAVRITWEIIEGKGIIAYAYLE